MNRETWAVAMMLALGMEMLLAQDRTRQPDHILDLVADRAPISPSADRSVTWMPAHPPTHSGSPVRFPFEVLLSSVDRSSYALAEEVIFELRLTNSSNEAIPFPRSLDGHTFTKDMPGARVLVVALSFKHPTLGLQQFAWQSVYGSEAVPGSLLTIRPSETLLIRAHGPITLNRPSSQTTPHGWMQEVKLNAYVRLDIPSHYYPSATSHNEVVVQLKAK